MTKRKHIDITRNIVILAVMSIDSKLAALSLSALGHEMRLHIYRFLVRAGDEGASVGEIGVHLGLPGSTLAHHLSALVQADLIVQDRQGRTIYNRANFDHMQMLIGFLSDECCVGNSTQANDNVA